MLPKVKSGLPHRQRLCLWHPLSDVGKGSVSSDCPVLAGTFGECSSEAEVQFWMRYNIFLLLEVGTFNALVELLNMEIE